MTEERVFVFDDRDNKRFYKLSYRGLIAMVFAAEQMNIWYQVSEIVNGGGVDRIMKVKGETIEMYDTNENLLSVSNV
jgi:hypothetical protein